MTMDLYPPAPPRPHPRRRLAALLLLTALAAGAALWLVMGLLFPGGFKPVTLRPKEAQRLQQKLKHLDSAVREAERKAQAAPDGLPPFTVEAYTESDPHHEIALSERELNALLATHPALARRLVIHLAGHHASAEMLVPLAPDLPLLGGRRVVVSAGLALNDSAHHPALTLKGINLWGVPLPTAWLGPQRRVDLARAFAQAPGLWHALADGVAELEVEQGQLRIEMND